MKLSKNIILAIFIGLFAFFLLLNVLQIITIHYWVLKGIPINEAYITIMKKWSEGFWKNTSWCINLFFIGREIIEKTKDKDKT